MKYDARDVRFGAHKAPQVLCQELFVFRLWVVELALIHLVQDCTYAALGSGLASSHPIDLSVRVLGLQVKGIEPLLGRSRAEMWA